MIHLTRRQSVLLASSLIALFFICMILLSKREQAFPDIEANGEPIFEGEQVTAVIMTPTAPPHVTAGAQFQLNNFHRSEVKNGKKEWEIKAAHGQYFPDRQAADLTDADVWVFRDEGKEIFLKAPTATLSFSGTQLIQAVFPQQVHVVYQDEMTLDTSQATYNKAEEIVTSTAPVKVVHEMMDITGERLKAELAAHKIVFSGGVTTLLKGKKKDARS